jgi:hypothetical protein
MGAHWDSVSAMYRPPESLYDSVREVLYKILIEFSTLMKLIMLIKVRLIETYSKVQRGKFLSDSFLSRTL